MLNWTIKYKIECLGQNLEDRVTFKGFIPYFFARQHIKKVYYKTLETLEIYNVIRQRGGKDGKRNYKVALRMQAGHQLSQLITNVETFSGSRAKYLAKAEAEKTLNVTIVSITLAKKLKLKPKKNA